MLNLIQNMYHVHYSETSRIMSWFKIYSAIFVIALACMNAEKCNNFGEKVSRLNRFYRNNEQKVGKEYKKPEK